MRNAVLAKIHIAKKDLRMDDVAYRAMLKRVTGKSSSAGMSPRQRGAVLAEFKRLGWNPSVAGQAAQNAVQGRERTNTRMGGRKQTNGGGSGEAGEARDGEYNKWRKPSGNPHIRKVWALGKELDNRGYWVLPWKEGLRKFVKKESGIDDPDWLDTEKASQIIEALKAIIARCKKVQA